MWFSLTHVYTLSVWRQKKVMVFIPCLILQSLILFIFVWMEEHYARFIVWIKRPVPLLYNGWAFTWYEIRIHFLSGTLLPISEWCTRSKSIPISNLLLFFSLSYSYAEWKRFWFWSEYAWAHHHVCEGIDWSQMQGRCFRHKLKLPAKPRTKMNTFDYFHCDSMASRSNKTFSIKVLSHIVE